MFEDWHVPKVHVIVGLRSGDLGLGVFDAEAHSVLDAHESQGG